VIKFLLTIGLIACLVACSRDDERVYPTSLQGGAKFEIGELVLLLMPDADQGAIGWEYRSNSDIQWITTSGYAERERDKGETEYYRDGVVRVNINGKVSTVLRERITELGWRVSFLSVSPPKFGVESIEIEPGSRDAPCFGTNYEGCWFESPIKSFSSASISAKLLCNVERGQEGVKAYELRHHDKRPVVMYWHESGGSGGSTAWLVLDLKQTPSTELCRAIEKKYFPLSATSDLVGQPDKTKQISKNLHTNDSSDKQKKTLEYDFESAQRMRVFDQMVAESSHCMESGAKAMLMQGSRNKEQILLFQTTVCGGPLVKFLISDGSMNTAQANEFVRFLAERVLVSVPGVK